METSENSYDVQIKKYLSENKHNLADVYSAHKKSLEACQEEINQWNKFIEDYNLLQTKLKSYPDKTSYPEAIPIGSLAYMKGYKIHTNEILVHLGDNWFAERSVKDTLAIIDRRKEVCKEQLHTSERAKKIHEGWLEQTQSLARESNLIEILEEISEEEYEKSKEKHKEMVNRHMALMSNNKSEDPDTKNNSLTSEVKAFEHLLKRLDVLEEEERALEGSTTELYAKPLLRQDEECYIQASEEDCDSSLMNSLSTCVLSSDKENNTGLKEKLRRRVSWADQLAEQKLRQDGEEEEEERHERSPMDTVHIKYRTRQQSLPAELISSWNPEYLTQKDSEVDEKMVDQETAEEEEAEADCELTTPQSPSDLYKMFGPHSELSIGSQPTKGILKKKGNSFQGEEVEKGVGWLDAAESVTYIANSPDEPKPLARKLPLSESPREIKKLNPAFSYKVVAHDPKDMDLDSPPQLPVSPQGEDEEEPKKISRFKAARLKNEA